MITNNLRSFSNEVVQDFVPNLEEKRRSRQSILFIDDDREQIAFYSILLRNAGFDVQSVSDSETALFLMSRHYFDAVVTDFRMPSENGFEFIARLRAIQTVPRSSRPVPVILLTACGSELEAPALSAGANMFCQKKDAKKILVPQLQQLLQS